MTYLIGIAGGSGSGKSTLAYSIQEKFPATVEALHFDDYQKSRKNVPISHNMPNWDHPDAINFSKLLQDLRQLKNKKDITIMTKSEKYNPNYAKNSRIHHLITAKPLILVEGYMAFTNELVRDQLDYKIFLDLSFNERMKRRTKFIDPDYTNKVLIPMHQKYVEPTKQFANLIINVNQYQKSEVLDLVIKNLSENNFI